MNENWLRFWAEIRRYARYMFLAPLIALLPFLLNLSHWQERGLWRGVLSAVVAGSAIGLTIALIFFAFYAALTQIAVRTGRFFQPPVFAQILLGSFGAMTGMWLVDFVRNWFSGISEPSQPLLPVLVFSGMIATAFSLFFAYQRAKEESLASRAEAAEARYHVLENQMRPHFLFNALNSLAELIESGREDAAETTYKLSSLYRRILASSGLKTASLESELEIVRDYLELEQLRFGTRLRFEIRAPENCSEIFLPSLTLQTLVENAVKHGIAPAIEGGKVLIEICHEGDVYRLKVENSGSPLKEALGSGTGLANTRARLDLLYGNRHGFELRSESGCVSASFRFTGENLG
ncbi:MAG: sensor histidine kinase [Blastocatellia bacterium]